MVPTAWTMGIEMQFYMLFPLICIPFRKKPVPTFIGMVIFSVALRLYLVANVNVGDMVMQACTPAYFDVFGFGMIAAYFVVWARNKLPNLDKLKPYMTAISVVCIFIAVQYIFWLSRISFPSGMNGDSHFRFLYRGIFAAIIAGFLFTVCFSYEWWEKKIWGNKVFIFLSSISYTVYFWHQNLYIFFKTIKVPYTTADPIMTDRNAMGSLVLICITLSIVIGVLVTKYIEKPIVKYGYKGCYDRIFNSKTNK